MTTEDFPPRIERGKPRLVVVLDAKNSIAWKSRYSGPQEAELPEIRLKLMGAYPPHSGWHHYEGVMRPHDMLTYWADFFGKFPHLEREIRELAEATFP